MTRHRTLRLIYGVVVSLLLILLPKTLSPTYVNLSIEIFVFALFAVSFNLLIGYCGLFPFGHAAMFGVGAYTAGLIFHYLPSMHLILTLLIGALSGFIAGILIGSFCVRLRGVYFAIISLAFQMFLFAVAWKWRAVTRGDDGIGIIRPNLHLPVLGSISMMNIQNLYWLTLVIVAIGIFACYLFLKTPLGNSVLCMRENDLRASFFGYHIFLTKLIVFSAAGLLAALAGALFVLFEEFVGINSIDINMSMIVILMVILGGRHFLGPVLGAAFYIIFQNWIASLTAHWWLIMGVLFVASILYLENGLISLLQLEKVRLWVGRRLK